MVFHCVIPLVYCIMQYTVHRVNLYHGKCYNIIIKSFIKYDASEEIYVYMFVYEITLLQ